ncbi:MAG: transglycosylase domain-containing protein [Bacteroidota bacterium]
MASPALPWWRRALAAVFRGIGRALGWVWSRIRRVFARLWAIIRDAQRPKRQRVGAAFGSLAFLGLVSGTALGMAILLTCVALIPFTPGVQDLRHAREIHPSVLVSADGVELTTLARGNRDWMTLDEISPHVVDALLATEDRRFYTHFGMDPIRLGGAVARTALGDPQGGSTLTQQLARNLFPTRIGRARSLNRKLKEAVTAIKIERVYTKDEILEIYLNTVPFLYNATGIEMAARTYFSTSAQQLDRLQAATLVGMLKGTSSYNPKRHPERALARRNVVLHQLVVTDRLSQEEYDRLKERPLGLQFERQALQTSKAPHFTEHVRVWLEDWADRNGYSVYGDGLTVHTTLDWRMQQAASESVRRFGDALQKVADVEWGRARADRLGSTTEPYVTASRRTEAFERFWTLRRSTAEAFTRETATYQRAVANGADPEATVDRLLNQEAFRDSLRAVKMRLELAFTAVDPATGQVRAWVGSRDYARAPYDHVARMRRQPGSTFKPFLYARALEEGFHPDDAFVDQPIAIQDGKTIWQPVNANGESSGDVVTLRDGLAKSVNTVAAQLVEEVGAKDLARTARRFGVRSELEAVPSLALGTSEVSLLEMASAYATIADGGTHRPPVWVTHIEDRDGTVIAHFAPPARRAYDPELDVQLLDMMRGVVDTGTGADVRRRFNVRGDLAGKTGTTQDGADGWFLLMHPDLVMGAWVGFDDPRVTFRSAYWGQGGHNALRVVGDFARTTQRRGLLATNRAFPRPEIEMEDDAPSVWDRFRAWAGGLFEREETTETEPESVRQPEDERRQPDPRPEPEEPEEAEHEHPEDDENEWEYDWDPEDWEPEPAPEMPTLPDWDEIDWDDLEAEGAEWLEDLVDELEDRGYNREQIDRVLHQAGSGWREAAEEAQEEVEREIQRAMRRALRRAAEAARDVEASIR